MKEGKKVGFACGVFDLFHIGHVLMLEECKANCDYLLIALNKGENLSSDKNQPIYSVEERKRILESCRYVDEVIIYNSEEELLEILKTKEIDVRFLGDDYRQKPITGAFLDIPIYYIDRSHGYSTSGMIKKVLERHQKK